MSDFDIQLARLDGSDVMPLTNAPEWDTDAKWSPDGNWLSFTRSPPSPTDCSDSVIWMMRRDGSEARPVVAGCGARWSPDGARLVYSSPTTGDLFVVAVNGGTPRRLLATRSHEFPAAWSPDGTRILFTRSYDRVGRIADVMVVNADGTRVRKLADGWAGSWSPNGSRIVYVGSPSALFVMRGDGSRARRISRWWARDPSWR